MRILVTGGLGFIGSHLVDRLVVDGHKVYVIDDLSGGYMENENLATFTFLADCRDTVAMDTIIKSVKPEVLYHLAANAAENKAQFSPIDVTSRNYDAFIKVLTSFIRHGGKKFIYTSSIAVYGALQTPFKEQDKPEPEDLYGITKLAAEQTLHVMSKVHDFQYVIVRPHNVYGPRQNMSDPYRNVVTIWMNAILRDEPRIIYGDGEQKRQFTYIDDLVHQLAQCVQPNIINTTFNIGASQSYTLKDLSDAITFITGDENVQHVPSRPQEVKEALADHKLADFVFGACTTDLKTGLQKTWEWCREEGAQELLYTEIEIPSKKLPVTWKK